jgi:hypothetical protein
MRGVKPDPRDNGQWVAIIPDPFKGGRSRKFSYDSQEQAVAGKLAVKNNVDRYLTDRDLIPPNVVDVVKWLASDKTDGFRKGAEDLPVTVSHVVARYLEKRQKDMERGEIVRKTLDSLEWFLYIFRDWNGKDTLVDQAFYETNLAEYTDYIRDRFPSKNSHRLAFSSLKAMTKWAYKMRYIPELPRNLDSDEFKYSGQPVEPHPMTLEHFAHLYKHAQERLRLYMILALNAGYTQKDIATLQHDMIDWNADPIVIERVRHKTETRSRCRQRAYLWDTTTSLLKKHATESNEQGGNLVLVSEEGAPLVREENSTDNIGTMFKRLKDKEEVETTHSFRDFRATGANEIDNGYEPAEGVSRVRTNTELADMFLAHTRQGIIKHYANPDLDALGHAAAWLGERVERALRDGGIQL